MLCYSRDSGIMLHCSYQHQSHAANIMPQGVAILTVILRLYDNVSEWGQNISMLKLQKDSSSCKYRCRMTCKTIFKGNTLQVVKIKKVGYSNLT